MSVFCGLLLCIPINVNGNSRSGEMDFKVKELWSTEKYYRPSWLAEKRNFWNLDALEWLKLKQYYFDLSDSLLIVSVLKLFLFFFVSLFFFLLLKKWRVHAPHLPVPAALNIIRVYIRYLVVNNTHREKFRNSSIQEYAILAVSDFCLQNQLKFYNFIEFYLFYKECRCLNKVIHQIHRRWRNAYAPINQFYGKMWLGPEGTMKNITLTWQTTEKHWQRQLPLLKCKKALVMLLRNIPEEEKCKFLNK